MPKPILCLDFDGVLHSYGSGWQGAITIPDPPVDGALQFVVTALPHFQVAIFSSRSRYWGGRSAMKAWLRAHLIAEAGQDFNDTPTWWGNYIAQTAFADPWVDEVAYAAKRVVQAIDWPLFKPPAMVGLDDRVITFEGRFPTIERLQRFQPWNKRGTGNAQGAR